MKSDQNDLVGIVRAMLTAPGKVHADVPDTLLAHRVKATALVEQLTGDERSILSYIVAGRSAKQIAEALEISFEEMQKQKWTLLQKLNAGSTSDAFRIGIYADLDEPE